MKANGFGSFEQTIVIVVDRADAGEVAKALRIDPFKETDDPPCAYFQWKPATTRPGRDDDIVYELGMHLPATVNWEIDWDASDY